MATAPRDENHVPTLLGTSNADNTTPVPILADPVTGRLLVNSTGGSSSGGGTTVVTAGTITIAAGTVSISAGSSNIGTVTVSGTANVNIAQVNGATVASAASGIQKVGVTDGSGNAVTSTSSALDVNIKSVSVVQSVNGSVSITAGTVSVNALPAGSNTIGTVTVSGTANVNVTQINGTTISTAAAGIQKTGLADGSGNAITSTASALDVNIKSTSVPQPVSGSVSITAGTVSINAIPSGSNAIGTVTVSGTANVNLAQVNGVTVATAAAGIQKAGLTDGTGNAITSTSSALDVNIKSVSVVQSVNGSVSITAGTVSINAIPAGSNNVGTVTVNVINAGSNNIGSVSIAAYPVTAASVNITQILGSGIVTGGVTGSQAVGGPTASGVTLAANPQTAGGLAKTTNPTAVTDGQVVNSLHDKLGKQVVVGAIRDLKAIQQTSINNSTATTTVVTAIASTFLDVYGCIVTNNASAVNKVTFADSSGGTTRWVLEVPATDTRGFMLPVDSAIVQSGSNAVWQAQCSVSGSVEVTMLYVKNT